MVGKIHFSVRFKSKDFSCLVEVSCQVDESQVHPSCSPIFPQFLADLNIPVHGPPLLDLITFRWHSAELICHLYGLHSTAAEGDHCGVYSPRQPKKACRFGSTSKM
mgnify:CR=1 FL=1